jgi:hypothetical protein
MPNEKRMGIFQSTEREQREERRQNFRVAALRENATGEQKRAFLNMIRDVVQKSNCSERFAPLIEQISELVNTVPNDPLSLFVYRDEQRRPAVVALALDSRVYTNKMDLVRYEHGILLKFLCGKDNEGYALF